MSRVKKRACFNCGQDATTAIQTRVLRGTHFLCMEQKCWDAYYALADSAPEQAKPARTRRSKT